VSTGILEGATEEEQATQLIVRALSVISIQRMKHYYLAAVDRLQRSAFMFAILVVAFLVEGQLTAKPLRHAGRVVLTALQSEQKRALGEHALAPGRLSWRVPHFWRMQHAPL
jgi:hypothetical protein